MTESVGAGSREGARRALAHRVSVTGRVISLSLAGLCLPSKYLLWDWKLCDCGPRVSTD